MKVTNKQIWEWIMFAYKCNKLLPYDHHFMEQKLVFEVKEIKANVLAWALLDQNKIEFQKRHFEESSIEAIKYTVIHEACHHIASRTYGDRGHGKYWKKCMKYCGYDKASIYNPYMKPGEIKGLGRKMKVYRVYCDCGEQRVYVRTYNKIKKRPDIYRCSYCESPVRLGEEVKQD